MTEAFPQPGEYDNEEPERICRAIREKRKYVLLRDGRVVTPENPEAAEFAGTGRRTSSKG